MSLAARLLALTLLGAVAGCGGPIDPERPPRYDYEFKPIHDQGDVFKTPSRI